MYLIATDNNSMKYIVNSWDVLTWTENYINNISLSDWTTTMNSPIINWVAKFLWINLKIPVNTEKTITVKLKPNQINWIKNDNKKIKLSLILKYVNWTWKSIYKTKFISLSNWKEISSWYIVTWENLLSNQMLIRGANIKYSFNLPWVTNWRTEVNSDWNQDLYGIQVNNLSSVNPVKVKQLTFHITANNLTWTSALKINDFKLYISSDWWNSWTNRSNLKNKVQFATWLAITWGNWNSTWWFTINWTKTINSAIHVRFTWDYVNWYTINTNSNLIFKLKANVAWLDNSSESIQLSVKEDTNPNADNWEMLTYSWYETWEPANNSIIWSDNINSNWLTKSTDKNWFEDYSLWDIDPQRVLYTKQ